MKELAAEVSVDRHRQGAMWGHSGGGFITADALLRAPYNDFFKVGIAESGNHDQRQYEDDWGERYRAAREESGRHRQLRDRGDADAGAGLKGHLC
jgi:Prolyl oligopeptidase family.